MRKNLTKKLTFTAVIAALYASITLILYPLSFSAVQIRASEAMALLPLLFPESAIGLTIGCLIANIFSGNALDVLFGTTATLISSVITLFIGKKVKIIPLKLIFSCATITIVNAVIVPLAYLTATNSPIIYLYNAICVGIGQAIAVVILGIPLYFLIKKYQKRKLYFSNMPFSGQNGAKL